MIKHLLTFAAVGVISGTVYTGCTDTSAKKVEDAKVQVDVAHQDLKAAEVKYADEIQSFKKESEQQIRDNDKSIDMLQAKMEKSGSKAKAKYSNKIADLRTKNHELKEKVEDYKDEGKDGWERFKDGFNRDMDKVKLSIKDLTTDND
jgi:hypothetical protein